MPNKIYKEKNILPPTILTIFGATGDLSANYLIPALLHMYEEKLLPLDFKLVCVGRRSFTTEEYLNFIFSKSSKIKHSANKNARKHFLKHLTYYRGDFENLDSFKGLISILEDNEQPEHKCYNRLYYFATSPDFFSPIANILKQSGLLATCVGHERKVRVLVEKPFGFDLKSAKALNGLLKKYFIENQIYRIDHYQGKETVQNLIVARFANSLFEPLWNKDFVDYVEISALGDERIGNRSAYYDKFGEIKDMLQNHILQILALIAMDEPKELTVDYIRDEKLKILKALKPFNSSLIKEYVIKGQYENYSKDIGKLISPTSLRASKTETYAALKVFIQNKRWNGVPFYLRTGKALRKKITEVSIHFKELPRCLFKGCAANVLTFRIQPDESVKLRINNKIPGLGITLHQSSLDFSFEKTFKAKIPSAYERLLLDFMEGDQRLFIRSDEIEASWKFVDSITNNWKNLPLYKYKVGSLGPKEAQEFMQKDSKEWWTK